MFLFETSNIPITSPPHTHSDLSFYLLDKQQILRPVGLKGLPVIDFKKLDIELSTDVKESATLSHFLQEPTQAEIQGCGVEFFSPFVNTGITAEFWNTPFFQELQMCSR